MQRTLDTGAVIERKGTYAMSDVVDIFPGDRQLAKIDSAVRKPSFGLTPEIHDDFNQVFQIGLPVQGVANVRRHNPQKQLQVVRDFLAWQFASPRERRIC
jgi:hypothetical protein